MTQYSPEAYEKVRALCQRHGLLSGARIHEAHVQKQVAKLLGISYVVPSPVVTDLILERRRERWQLALVRNLGNNQTLRATLIQNIRDSHLRQWPLWPSIRGTIALHNSTYPDDRLPHDKHNIALSLWGRREMKLEEFMTALGLEMPDGMESPTQSPDSLRTLWRESLDRTFLVSNEEVTLRAALLSIEMDQTGRELWQKKILEIIREFESQNGTALGGSNWTTLSRSIIHKEHDYVSYVDFRRFVEKATANANSPLNQEKPAYSGNQ